MERCFGVFLGQFFILQYNPCRLYDLEYMKTVVKACVIIHNMVADERGYDETMRFRQKLEARYGQTQAAVIDDIICPECVYQQTGVWRQELECLENLREHVLLSSAL